ncbi:hypothetical protein AG1IA_09792 [Rhizoctonia solani AG-1 IA]|uniref:Uncharacterized protein n=1 Tax=Thanatephorus cucumeris (strain AG1-IA) TaxID=983506 RepID=L8WHB5_THACA|nr:hypothetical protein AG1IA_09792 [Rhizoctonia solani AG-1 IA]
MDILLSLNCSGILTTYAISLPLVVYLGIDGTARLLPPHLFSLFHYLSSLYALRLVRSACFDSHSFTPANSSRLGCRWDFRDLQRACVCMLDRRSFRYLDALFRGCFLIGENIRTIAGLGYGQRLLDPLGVDEGNSLALPDTHHYHVLAGLPCVPGHDAKARAYSLARWALYLSKDRRAVLAKVTLTVGRCQDGSPPVAMGL